MVLGRPRLITDEAILAALGRAIARVGPSRLTLSEVASEAGVTAPAIAQRFGSKRNLLLAFAAQAPKLVPESFARARASHPTPLAALLADPLGAANVMASPGALANHLAFLQLELADPEFRQHTLEHASVTREQIRQLLDDAIEQGELRQCDTRALSQALLVAHNGTLVTWAIFREGQLAPALRNQLEFVLAPFRAAAGPEVDAT